MARVQAAMGARPAAASLAQIRAGMEATMGALPLAEGVVAEEADAGGVPVIVCRREDGADDPWVLYFHGGGYRMGSARAYRSMASKLAGAWRARIALVDYRLAPEHPYPAAVEDARRAYQWILQSAGGAGAVVIGGDSAGGGLTGALLLSIKRDGWAAPCGAFMLSPWLDLTNRADSFVSRSGTDALFSKASADEAAGLYVAGGDAADPLISPRFGDWSGMLPLLVQGSAGPRSCSTTPWVWPRRYGTRMGASIWKWCPACRTCGRCTIPPFRRRSRRWSTSGASWRG